MPFQGVQRNDASCGNGSELQADLVPLREQMSQPVNRVAVCNGQPASAE